MAGIAGWRMQPKLGMAAFPPVDTNRPTRTIEIDGQESPYFVTYDHHMEEPGNLEIETSTTMGIPRSGQKFFVAPYAEFEYGLTGRWTTELYLEGAATAGDSA